MKVSHEVPLSLLEDSLGFNDYDYCLVHKYLEDEVYAEFYRDSLKLGRTVYLDNSLFELGEMFSHEEFAKVVEELGGINPDNFYYIVPDLMNEREPTELSWVSFTYKYPDLPGKTMGVVQGDSYEEMKRCYQFMSKRADMVAISFGYKYFSEGTSDLPKAWMQGRQRLIKRFIQEGIINYNKPHHLLGCGLPQEFKDYTDDKFIVSCDTSNPVVHAIKGIEYSINGLDGKESIKLVDLFDTSKDKIDMNILNKNLEIFKTFTKRK